MSVRPVTPTAGATVPRRHLDEPLWSQVHADLVTRLAAGEFGHAFPGELALCEEYGVSRHTIREALRPLRDDGVITAERGRTSRVSTPAEIAQPLGSLYSLFTLVNDAGKRQRSVVRRQSITRDALVAVRLGLEESTPLFYLERVRWADDRPLAIDRLWTPADVAAPLLHADFSETGFYAELSEHSGISMISGEETIRAVLPTAAERRLLEISDQVAVFAIERMASSDSSLVEWRHTLVRGDRFALSATFSGREGYQVPA